MRLIRPPTLLTLLSTLLACTHAFPANTDASSDDENLKQLLESRYHYLSARSCANPCGWSGQVCCGSGQTCTTNSAGQAACAGSATGSGAEQADAENGQWEYYTTTYVETDLETYTSTYSSFFGSETSAAPAAISGISCNSGLGESPCGTLCCATGQYCAYAGQCAASNNAGESSSALTVVSTATAAASAPVRPTSNAATTVTSTGSATTTVPYMTPTAGGASASASSLPGMTATTSNNGLSAGAIAGIVIGVLAGLFFLFIICAILCCKGLIDGILDFFGLRSRRNRRETYIEEEHRHSGRTWYGARKPTTVTEKRKSSGIGGLTGVAGALGLLAIALGLKRRSDRRRSEKAASRYTESSYDDYYSDTSPSEFPPHITLRTISKLLTIAQVQCLQIGGAVGRERRRKLKERRLDDDDDCCQIVVF